MNFFQKLFHTQPHEPEYKPDTITVQGENDGTFDVAKGDMASAMFSSAGIGVAELPQSEQESIKEYRRLAMTAEVDEAIQEIVNESFNISQNQEAIKMSFNPETELSKSVQESISEVWHDVYHKLFDFDNRGAIIFRKFYVDGRLFIHKVVSKDKKRIAKLQIVDALQMRRIKSTDADDNGLIDLSREEIVYFYNPIPSIDANNALWEAGYRTKPSQLIAFPEQAIAYTDSGLTHYQRGYIVSHLSKAIVPYNNMKMMEDAMVVYRVIRAPSRRVFYVDVGDMQKAKGEAYLKDVMTRFKNKMVYDSETGLVADRRNIMSMLDDIWLPRKSNGRSTEVTTLDEGSNLGVTEDVEYCRERFYRSLNIPKSRFAQEQNPFGVGRVTEITRDEYRFHKFIQSQRNRFIVVIEDVLRTELVLRGIIKDKEWKAIRSELTWVFAEDSQFVQLKQSEILQNKLNTMQQIDGMVDRYFSRDWALRNIMQFTDAEIEQLELERENDGSNDNDEYSSNGTTDNQETNYEERKIHIPAMAAGSQTSQDFRDA